MLQLDAYQTKKIAHAHEVEQLKLEYEKGQLELQLNIQEATLNNISREIHDNIGLSLTLAKLHLNTLESTDKNTLNPKIETSVQLISTAINDLNDISKGLSSEAIAQQGIIRAFETEIEKVNKLNNIHINFEVLGQPLFLNTTKELMLYRITQEAFNNIIKHSKANMIDLRLSYTPSSLQLSINDNGIGINWKELEEKKSFRAMSGLNNMKERARKINGNLTIQSEPNKGTSIHIKIPFDEHDKQQNH